MLSLSRHPTSRCLASRQGRSARPAVSSASLLQGQRRRLRPAAATPGEADKDFGLAPESGTGGSGLGRSQGTARPLSGDDNAGIGSAPEAGTRAGESSPSGAGRAAEGTWAAQQAGQDVRSPTGRSSSTLTGQVAGGQHEVSAGWEVPTSDTTPAMDPAESKKYTERETQGSTSVPSGSGSQSSAAPQSKRQQGSGSGQAQGRDESDSQMGGEGSGGGASDTRTHPVSRTAATAIGSAAGTILGAVGGPVGAAAGAALGGGAARRIADAFGGNEEQAEVYDQGAEPEQVAEELLGARAAVGERLDGARGAAGDLADDIKGRAQEAKEAVQDKLDRASERTEGSTRDAQQQMDRQQGRTRGDQGDLQGGIGARVQFVGDESGRGDTGGSSSSSGRADTGGSSSSGGRGGHEHGKGLGDAIADAAKTAAQKMGSAADAVTGHVQLPEFPPSEGEASKAGTMRAADDLRDAAKSAANKVASAGEGVPLPEYPPAQGKAADYDTIGSGSGKGEQGQAGRSTSTSSAGGYSDGKSVGDWVRESAEWLGDSIADTAGAARQEQRPSGQEAAGGVGDVLRSTVRTAADFGSPETSERLTEMAAQSEQQQGVQDSSSRGGAGGSRSGDSAGVPDGWGDVSGLSDALGMGEAVEGGYYAYRSIDDASGQPGGGSGSVDPTNSLSFRRRSARGSRGSDRPLAVHPAEGRGGLGGGSGSAPPAAGSGGSASAAADVPRAAAAAAPGGDLSANAGGAGGMSGAVGGAGGYGGGASEFGEGMDQARAQASSSGAPQVRSAGGSGGQQGAGRVGNKAVDEGLPEGRLAAGGEDAQAAVGVGRDESAGSATSDSTADRVAQVYGLGADASAGAEEASVYKKEAGQEEQQDEGARKAFEGA